MGRDKLPLVPGRTTPSFGFSNLERAIKECLGERIFGRAEKQAVIDFFGQIECVYCGTAHLQRWDHLTAIRNDGETVLGNVVLACGSCDDSKQHYYYRDFMLGGMSVVDLGVCTSRVYLHLCSCSRQTKTVVRSYLRLIATPTCSLQRLNWLTGKHL